MKNQHNLILLDLPEVKANLLPLSFTRPVCNLRVGITTIRTKWEHFLGVESSSTVSDDYLAEKFPAKYADGEDNLLVAGHILPDKDLADAIASLRQGMRLCTADGSFIAARGSREQLEQIDLLTPAEYSGNIQAINKLYDIFLLNGAMIAADFKWDISSLSQPVSSTNTIIGPNADPDGNPLIHIAEGAKVEGAMLNTTAGPIYIGPDAEVMEGSCLRGPIAICRHATVNMGTKIYPATTIGPWSKVGGELNNVVIIGYSNKAHDGFLGNAVIGEWCNLGAGCVASNLKNDYTPIKLWNYPAHRFLKTGLQFCGLIMGDHSKAGINTMFNTATVVGVGVNIHGSGFPRNFIASFLEGGASGFTDVQLTKFFDIARRVMARRGVELTETDCRIFEKIFQVADTYK